MSSACAAAVSCVQHVRAQQAQAVQEVVRARHSGREPRSTFHHLNTFKQDAPWRSQPASDRQLQMLKQLEVGCDTAWPQMRSLGATILYNRCTQYWLPILTVFKACSNKVYGALDLHTNTLLHGS